jgi:hypothetical protein
MKEIKIKGSSQKSINQKKSNDLKVFASKFRISGVKSAYAGFGVIWAINISTIFRSSWAGDDWPISQTPYWIQWRYGALTNWNIWTEAMFWNDQWMKGAGRFYPLTWIESRFAFSYLLELWQYKFYQVGMLFFAGLLLVVICYLFTRSHTFSIFALASLSLTVQFRRDFDPHLAFAVMLPSLLIKIFLAVIFAYLAGRTSKKSKGAFLGFIAGILFFAGMSTYEFGFLLFPLLVFSFLIGTISKQSEDVKLNKKELYVGWLFSIKFLPIIISWVGYGLFVFGYLRPRASSISGSYVLGLSWSSFKVFFSQVIMGLPLVSLRNGDLSFSLFTIIAGLSLLLLCRFSFKRLFAGQIGRSGRAEIQGRDFVAKMQNSYLILLFALTMISSPGFMMAMQPTWWNRADLQHTYLGVMITEFGTAIIIAYILERIVTSNIKFMSAKKSRT